MSSAEEKVTETPKLPFSTQGMDPATVYFKILPIFRGSKTAAFLAQVCNTYFNDTHSAINVINFLQMVFRDEPGLSITLPKIREALNTLDPKPTELLNWIVEPKNTKIFPVSDEINQILEPLKKKELSIREIAKEIQGMLDHAEAKNDEDKKSLICEVIMHLEYQDKPEIAGLLQAFYSVSHQKLVDLYRHSTPPGKGSLPAIKQAMLCALHMQGDKSILSLANETIPFQTIKSLETLDTPSYQIVAHIVKGQPDLAKALQKKHGISNREMWELCARSEKLAFMRGDEGLCKQLKQAKKHFAALYEEQLVKANLPKINERIMKRDLAAPNAEMQYKRSVLADYRADIVAYREQRGLHLADSNFRALGRMVIPVELLTYTDDIENIYRRIPNIEKFTEKDFSAIDREVKAQQKENNTHLLFLASLIANCYGNNQAALAKQLQKKYRISDAEMALVFENSAAALKPPSDNEALIHAYNAYARKLNPNPVFARLTMEGVRIDLSIVEGKTVTDKTVGPKPVTEILHLDLPTFIGFKNVMDTLGGINTDLSTICSLIAYCELQNNKQKNEIHTRWVEYLKKQYGINDAMMLLVCQQSKDVPQELTAFYQEQCKGVAKLLVPLETWIHGVPVLLGRLDTWLEKTMLEPLRRTQCALVIAFRNEIIKLYQDPNCLPNKEQETILMDMGRELIEYCNVEHALSECVNRPRKPGREVIEYMEDTLLAEIKSKLLNLNEQLYHARLDKKQELAGLFLATITVIGGIVLFALGVGLMAAAAVALIAAFGPAGVLGAGAIATAITSIATELPVLAVVGGAAFVGYQGATLAQAGAVFGLYSSRPHKFFKPRQTAEKLSELVKGQLLSPQEGKKEEGPPRPKSG